MAKGRNVKIKLNTIDLKEEIDDLKEEIEELEEKLEEQTKEYKYKTKRDLIVDGKIYRVRNGIVILPKKLDKLPVGVTEC